jgi:hypothetical protein
MNPIVAAALEFQGTQKGNGYFPEIEKIACTAEVR